jgi:hypothetical protein
MLKQALLALTLALSFFAAIGAEASVPPPGCAPCPWVN